MLTPRTRTVPASGPGKRPRRAYEAAIGSPAERQRNALIVSMLAYGGLRPFEDRASKWSDLREIRTGLAQGPRAMTFSLQLPVDGRSQCPLAPLWIKNHWEAGEFEFLVSSEQKKLP